jgi:site-specific DNA-methyltransferase (adenine-specific)
MTPYYSQDGIVIYHGMAESVLPSLPDSMSDLVLTDPPYPKDFDAVWQVLAEQGARLLSDCGSLVTLCGNSQVPLVIESLSKVLRYWWLGGMLNQENGYRLPGKWVFTTGKPCLWYVKGSRRKGDTECPCDFRSGGGREKGSHPWQQPVAWFRHWAERLGGDKPILDPFMGSGTTLRAAKDLGLKAVGVEKEERYCEAAANRLAQGMLSFPLEEKLGILPPADLFGGRS